MFFMVGKSSTLRMGVQGVLGDFIFPQKKCVFAENGELPLKVFQKITQETNPSFHLQNDP